MAQDALIRVRLDTSGAKSDLAALYGEMRRSPGVSGGVAAGAMRGAGPPQGMLGMGGFDIGSILMSVAKWAPIAAIGRGALGTAMDVGGALTAGPAAMLERAIFGDIKGEIQGAQSARDAVVGMTGTAVGYGLMTASQAKGLWDTIKDPYIKKAVGEKQVRDEINVEISKNVFDKMLEQLVLIAGILAAIKVATMIEAANPL